MAPFLHRPVIEAAERRIRPFIHKTPVLTSTFLDSLSGKKLFFKCENLQKTGSFKARGALNAISTAREEGALNGVITQSSGNHGQGLAWAAAQTNTPCVVVVPKNAPQPKIEAMRGYGAEIVFCEASMKDRLETCERLAKEKGYRTIDPHNDYDVMAGQGTIGLEFLEQVPSLDAVIIAIGGGGLAGGVSRYISEKNENCKVFCVEPEGKELSKSLDARDRLWDDSKLLTTIADGCRPLRVADKCFGELLDTVSNDHVITVSDVEIAQSMKLIFERMKLVIEPSAAMGLAAVLQKPEILQDCQNIGIILCGGNVDLTNAVKLMYP
uniref:Serine racemase n=1 Tax=Steinernema glaseri TaxID=37863 RepID=A0A1I7YRN3_9BILA